MRAHGFRALGTRRRFHFVALPDGLLIASVPIWTALLARFMLHEKLTAIGWFGVLLSFAGVALISAGESEGFHLSAQALFLLAAAITSAVYMIMQKNYLQRYSALEFTAYSIWFGTLMLVPFGRGFLESLRSAPPAATLSVVTWNLPGALAYRVGLRAFAWDSGRPPPCSI
jgi:drug/metabolite transporter (DMT)-like permease